MPPLPAWRYVYTEQSLPQKGKHDECEVCGQPFDLEVGFYYGSSYVSYALCIAISVASFIAWWLLIGVSINDSRVYWWLAFNAGLLIAGQPVLMRVARSGWLAVFVRHNPNWRNEKAPATERMIEKFKNAW